MGAGCPSMSWRSPLPYAFLALSGACNHSSTELPPLGEVLLVVDTDAAVPSLVGRLRVDAYAEDGTWYASRDFGLEDAVLWPSSFGVYSGVADQGGVVTLRLRGYADGNVRDYLGERYQARPSGEPPSQVVPTPSPPPGEAPRLVATDGSDVTPTTEPQPLLAIDRLVLLRVSPGVVESASVVLRGVCFGTMADVAKGETCVDTENTRVPVTAATLGPDRPLPATSLQGTFGATVPCTAAPRGAHRAADGTPLYDQEVCIGGGTFVFGKYPDLSPERIVTVPPFLMDKYEVSVARWRQALAKGLVSTGTPVANDHSLPLAADYESQSGQAFCTYSTTSEGREDFPVSCIDWTDARAFCKLEGGDLPSEVQWEWVVSSAGRAAKTAYPWGGPDECTFSCTRGDFARGYAGTEVAGQCLSTGLGPASVVDADHPDGDRSAGFGVVDLGFNLSEWLEDSADALDTRCWLGQPLMATACEDPEKGSRAVRGASWVDPSFDASYDDQSGVPASEYSTTVGFRCVRASP